MLSPQELKLLISIVDCHVELLDDRAAYFQGDIHGDTFDGIITERQQAFRLMCKLKELSISGKQFYSIAIAVQMPDRFVDRN